MSTAKSVKDQLRKLIEQANLTTNKEDATLTDAQASLIEGYGAGGPGADSGFINVEEVAM